MLSEPAVIAVRPATVRPWQAATFVLVALCKRPLLASVAPVLPEIIRDTGLSQSGASLLTALPVLCLGLSTGFSLSVRFCVAWWLLRRKIDSRQLIPFVRPGVPGVLCGVFALLHLQANTYMHVLAWILIVYGSYMLVGRPIKLRQTSTVGDAMSGSWVECSGGLAATPSAPVVIWGATKGWDKTRQGALYQHSL